MSFKTARARAVGMGSAKEGVGHWWTHRVSSIALIPLTLLFLFPFVGALGQPHDEVLAIYRNPFNAIVAILFIGTAFHHLMQGVQVVIEDYVHGKLALTLALVANTLLCWAFGLAGVFAVAKIAFSG